MPPPEMDLSQHQIWGLRLIQSFFDAQRKGRLPDFIESDELRKFLHRAMEGSFGTKVPDGSPGSKIPQAGGRSPIDVLHDLFRGLGFSLGKVDHPGGGDPAADRDEHEGTEVLPSGKRITVHTDPATGDRTTVDARPDGSIRSDTVHRNGTRDSFELLTNGTYRSEHSAGPGNYDRIEVRPGPAPGDCVIYEFHGRPGLAETGTRTVYPPGRQTSPGEDGGGDGNSGRNPLSGLEAVGPQSMGQMVNQMEHPGSDSEKDPNTGKGPTLSDAEQEKLRRIAPGAEKVDPNSGQDPLSTLNLDPSKLHTRNEDDDRIDPNTGQKPVPGGG